MRCKPRSPWSSSSAWCLLPLSPSPAGFHFTDLHQTKAAFFKMLRNQFCELAAYPTRRCYATTHVFSALTLNQSKKPGSGCSHFFWQVLFSLQQLHSLSSNCCRFSQRWPFLSVGFSPFDSFPLFPHSCPGFWWPLCLFSAWRSGHTAAFLCCLEPNIVLIVFSFIPEDMWRVMWLFIVRHVTCKCVKKKKSVPVAVAWKLFVINSFFFFFTSLQWIFFLFSVSRLMETNLPSVLFCLFTRKALWRRC